MTFYKFLRSNRMSQNSEYQWPEPGTWTQLVRNPIECTRGYHLARPQDLPLWVLPRLWVAEPAPGCKVHECDDKVFVSRARLVEPTTWSYATFRAFGYACADRAVHVLLPRFASQSIAEATRQLPPVVDAETARLVARLSMSSREVLRDIRSAQLLGTCRSVAKFAISGSPEWAGIAACRMILRAGESRSAMLEEYAWQANWILGAIGAPSIDTQASTTGRNQA